jgi:hypothetical protein
LVLVVKIFQNQRAAGSGSLKENQNQMALVPVISKPFRTCSFCETTGKELVGFWLVT